MLVTITQSQFKAAGTKPSDSSTISTINLLLSSFKNAAQPWCDVSLSPNKIFEGISNKTQISDWAYLVTHIK